tara:strand:+ start:82 stop:507 length:426 start_codon:yes stop_codon:yes gene_type:complete
MALKTVEEITKIWRLNNPKRMKKYKIQSWKNQGLISNDFDSIYTRYINSTNCKKCGHDYSYYKKCMDHCHITGAFRNILCHSCNMNDNSKNTSGYANICKNGDYWVYNRKFKHKNHRKGFKTKSEAIIYKWLYELGYSIEF